MIRLFLAIPVPPKVKKNLALEIEKIKALLFDWKISWDNPQKLHVTLIFLGWVPEEKVKILEQEAADATKNFPSFEISTGPLTEMDNPIWFEIKEGKMNIEKLQKRVGEKLSIKGSFLEKRPFHAHLTIGRIKKSAKGPSASGGKGKSKLPLETKELTWKADRVVIYQSKLRRSGSIYTELASFPLT